VAKVVAPKKAKLAEAEAEYTSLMAGLRIKKSELAAVKERVAVLNAKLGAIHERAAGPAGC
jgi:dynein heavy chain